MVVVRHGGVVEERSHAGLASVFDQKGSWSDILIRSTFKSRLASTIKTATLD